MRASDLLSISDNYGLSGGGYAVSFDDIDELRPGAILHWDRNHYVVLEGTSSKTITILDPAVGRRRVDRTQAANSFSGVVLVFEPTDRFVKKKPPTTPSAVRQFARVIGSGRRFWAALTLSLALQLLSVGGPIVAGLALDRAISGREFSQAEMWLGAVAAITVMTLFTALLRGSILLTIRLTIHADLARQFVSSLLRLPLSYVQDRPSGDLASRLSCIADLRELISGASLSSTLDGLLASTTCLALLIVNRPIAMLSMALATVEIGAFIATRAVLRDYVAASLAAQANTQTREIEVISGIESLKSLGIEKTAFNLWHADFTVSMGWSRRRGRIGVALSAVTTTVRACAPVIVALLGAKLIIASHLSFGQFVAAETLALSMLSPVANFFQSASQLGTAKKYLERINDIIDAPSELKDDASLDRVPARAISLDKVTFAYPGQTATLHEVSLEVKEGEFVAIVGSSGCGKSTLTKVILGLCMPQQGRVIIDGRSMAEIDVFSLRQCIGSVPQQPYLFTGTIGSNISLGKTDATAEEIEAAAHRATLDADVSMLPMGYDTPVQSGGVGLSGGQRQKIALARALLRQPVILILDEATSSLDAVAERAIQSALEQLACTRIVVAHRLSTVVNADKIVVMKEGRVVESGRHAVLMARGGEYANLFAASLSAAERVS